MCSFSCVTSGCTVPLTGGESLQIGESCRSGAVCVFLLLCCQLSNFYCKSCSSGVFHFPNGETYFLLLSVKSLFSSYCWKHQYPQLCRWETPKNQVLLTLVTSRRNVFITLRSTGGLFWGFAFVVGWLGFFWFFFFQSVELISLKKLVEISPVELLMYC